MKQLSKIVTFALIVLAFVGCREFHTLSKDGKKPIQGGAYEVLVVCDNSEWESPLGTKLRELLEQPVEMLNQNEPMFNVLRITSGDLRHLLLQHRNILKVVISDKVAQAQINAQYDLDAAPQIVLTFQAPTQKAALEYLEANGDALTKVLEIAERNRTIAYAEKHNVKVLNDLLHSEFDIDAKIPKGYELRSQSENFLWASYEFPTASQGFFCYSYPYRGKGSLTADYLVAMRNSFAKRIPGPSDGSYMITVEQIPDAEGKGVLPLRPLYRSVVVNGREWIEMRGFWDVENDYMGGPFVSYTTVNDATNEVFTIDCYVFSPKYGKRNFLRPLEHLVYLISFPQSVEQQK
ncbi:MAG: DUF4837 family protein [Alistipes sp.]|jgi:hypothetical protein|nr:DUF4837 family protein [Alistipes sp.]MBQ5353432.1 DUF4837 family protein [Alistipes sp.]MBR2116986.1 DUF4837 family protein [Alistipes sp.]